jgi:CheY-like chemotaxis protein
MSVRVLIADDVEVIRTAIRDLLASEPTVEVCGEAVNFSQTIYLAATLQPDVILLDLHMTDGDSFESAFVKLRQLSIGSRILAMSLRQDEETQIIGQGSSSSTRENSSMNQSLQFDVQAARSTIVFDSRNHSGECLRLHSAWASSNCSTNAGSGAFPIFALGETMYRAALPKFRNWSSDIFRSRVRKASRSKFAN